MSRVQPEEAFRIPADWNQRLKSTDTALRARLARPSRLREPAADTAPALAGTAAEPVAGHELTDAAGPELPRKPVLDGPAPLPSGAEPSVLPPSFLPLSALDRIFQPSRERDFTLLYALLIVLLLHTGALIGAIELAGTYPNLDTQGQVDNPNSIAVELVEAPDANATEKSAQIGAEKPPEPVRPKENLTEPVAPPLPPQQPQAPQAPQPPQEAKPQQQPQNVEPKPEPKPEQEAKPEQETKPEKAAQEPKPGKGIKLPEADDGLEQPGIEYDFAAGDPVVRVSANPAAPPPQDAREARDASDPTDPQPPPNVAQKRLAAAPKGQQSGYRTGVLKKLALSKPQLWTNLAEVRMMFVISPEGEPIRVRLLQSSRDHVFDDVALEWIRRARFAPPPPNAKPEDLVYVIHYVIQ